MFQQIDLDFSNKHAASAPRNVAFDIGRLPSESVAELENLMDHHGDGIRRCHSSPAVSNG